MVFSSPIFLFGFLPLVILFYYLSPKKLKNITLLVFSLIFYAWGEVFYIFVMLVSISSNYLFGRLIEIDNDKKRKLYLAIGIAINLLLLVAFKYAGFITENINILLAYFKFEQIDLVPIHLPLGISFFTFQAISYIVDVYRREVSAQKNIFDLALYISLFPQLIAGPIVRYHDVARQIIQREHSFELFASGVERFIYGFAKKMLIANPLGEVADSIFSLPQNELTMPLAWIGIIAYSLQIFFDFSGYSDMAIGLGRMFGFNFLENFNYPYIAKSLKEFWRRWHISLSTWFRDYVYIPLGGNRVSTLRVYINLFLVFTLTGFWHGASWNFLAWGLLHGVFLASEHAGLSNLIKNLPRFIQHLYVLIVVLIAWVFFRAEDLSQALAYIYAMFNVTSMHISTLQIAQNLSYEAFYAFLVAVMLCTPIYPKLKQYLYECVQDNTLKLISLVYLPYLLLLALLFFISMTKIAALTYNPFIYFRF